MKPEPVRTFWSISSFTRPTVASRADDAVAPHDPPCPPSPSMSTDPDVDDTSS